MALDAFHEHWRTRHAEIIVRLPGIRRYVQNYPIADGGPFDAVAESSFDDSQAMKALARTPEYAAVLADEPNFIDRASMGTIVTEEHVLKAGTAGVKHMRFVRRDLGTPIDKFFSAFLEEGRRAAQAPGVLGYAQCHTRRSAYDSGRTPAYDAVTMTWFASPPAELGGAIAVNERLVL